MPRVSAQHEQAVRDRIVRAAIGVFAEHGFHRATMQDIVRKSGLSVGALHSHLESDLRPCCLCVVGRHYRLAVFC